MGYVLAGITCWVDYCDVKYFRREGSFGKNVEIR